MGFMVNTGLKRGVRAWFKPSGVCTNHTPRGSTLVPPGVAPSYPQG